MTGQVKFYDDNELEVIPVRMLKMTMMVIVMMVMMMTTLLMLMVVVLVRLILLPLAGDE